MLPENGQPLKMDEVIAALVREFRRSLLLIDLNTQTTDAYDNKAERKHFHRCHVQPPSPLWDQRAEAGFAPQSPPSLAWSMFEGLTAF